MTLEFHRKKMSIVTYFQLLNQNLRLNWGCTSTLDPETRMNVTGRQVQHDVTRGVTEGIIIHLDVALNLFQGLLG